MQLEEWFDLDCTVMISMRICMKTKDLYGKCVIKLCLTLTFVSP